MPINGSYDCMFWYVSGGGFKPLVLIAYQVLYYTIPPALSDTTDAIIKESTSVERELRWFLSALPAIVSTEVMGSGDPVSPEEQGWIRDSSTPWQLATRPYRIKISC